MFCVKARLILYSIHIQSCIPNSAACMSQCKKEAVDRTKSALLDLYFSKDFSNSKGTCTRRLFRVQSASNSALLSFSIFGVNHKLSPATSVQAYTDVAAKLNFSFMS